MQAILILAHKNIEQVTKLATILHNNFEVYIHFDKKMNIPENYKQILDKKNIHYISKIDVHWGSWSIGAATVLLMKEVLKNRQIEYIHVISGQDWLTIPSKNIYDKFIDNDRIYMTYSKAKNVKKKVNPSFYGKNITSITTKLIVVQHSAKSIIEDYY